MLRRFIDYYKPHRKLFLPICFLPFCWLCATCFTR